MLPAQLEAVHARHQHVEHDRVRRARVERVERLVPVGRQQHVVAVEAQGALDRLAHGGLVVDHEDAHRGSTLRPQPKRKLNGW